MRKPGEVHLLFADYEVSIYINLNLFKNELGLVAMREGLRHIDGIVMRGDGLKDLVGEDYP